MSWSRFICAAVMILPWMVEARDFSLVIFMLDMMDVMID
jgi:hypothetical protein